MLLSEGFFSIRETSDCLKCEKSSPIADSPSTPLACATTASTLLDTASTRWLGDLKSTKLDQLHVVLLTVREPNSPTLKFLLFCARVF
jgi:hypothetical protein